MGAFDDLVPNALVDRVSKGILGEEHGVTTSPQGARGVGQIMPATFKQYALPYENIDNPDHNKAVHRRMIYDFVVNKKMSPEQAATAYFSGEGNVNRGGPTPWKQNRADVNEDVASYVQHVDKRMSGNPFTDLIPKKGKSNPFGDLVPYHDRPAVGQDQSPLHDRPPNMGQKVPLEGLNVEKRAWQMLQQDPVGFFKKLGGAILTEGKGAIEPLGVVGDIAQGKAKIEDPETQQRVIAAGTLIGGSMTTPAARIATPAIKPEGEPPIPGPNHPAIREGGVEGKPGFVTTEGEFVNRGEAAPIAEAAGQKLPGTGDSLHSEDLKPGTSEAVAPLGPGGRKYLGVNHKGQKVYDNFGEGVVVSANNGKVDLVDGKDARIVEPATTSSYTLHPEKDVSGKRITGAREKLPANQQTSVSLSAATTPLSDIVKHNLKTFEEENAKTPGFKEGLRAATNTIKAFTAPETIKDPLTGAKTAAKAASNIMSKTGEETRVAYQAQAAMDKFSEFTNSLNLDEQLSLIKWMQSATTPRGIFMDSEGAKFAEAFSSWMQTYEKKLRALPDMEQMEFRQNFVHQAWKQPDKVASYLFGPSKVGSSGFTKKHVFEDYEEGIRAGYVPVSTNPMEIFARYVENAATFIANKRILADAKDEGLVVQRPIGTAPPEGWIEVNGASHPGTKLYAPQGWATVYNNHVSQPPRGFGGNALKAVQWATNTSTALHLTLSGFHATLETAVGWASGLADAITKGKNGDILGAGWALIKTPAKPFTSPFAARKSWAIYKDITGSLGDPLTRRAVDMLTQGNFDFQREGRIADEYRNSRLPGLIKSWERGRLQTQMRDAFADIKNRPFTGSINVVFDRAMQALHTIMEPIFQYYVPWLKTQAAVDAAKTWIKAHPDATSEEFAKAGQDISKQMDARFGEMNRNNIFWSQTQKAITQAIMLSYSYTYGLAHNALGVGFDLAKIPPKTYSRIKGVKSAEDIWTERLSFAIAMPVIYVTMNAIYNYMMTGNAPDTEDLTHPRTGGTNEGKPERATIPNHMNSYINFFENPFGDAYNKINPLWQTTKDWVTSKDYREHQIVDPQDPMVSKIAQWSWYVTKSLGEPISVNQILNPKAGSNVGPVQSAFGIRPAGFAVTNPDSFKQMMNYKDSEAKYESEKAKIDDELVRRGRPRLVITNNPYKHPNKQDFIRAIMQGKDPFEQLRKNYGGTQ